MKRDDPMVGVRPQFLTVALLPRSLQCQSRSSALPALPHTGLRAVMRIASARWRTPRPPLNVHAVICPRLCIVRFRSGSRAHTPQSWALFPPGAASLSTAIVCVLLGP